MTYDPFHHRWIAVAIAQFASPDPLVLLAVSSNSVPTNGWIIRYIDADADNTLIPDSTTVGFNKDWIVVQAVLRRPGTNVHSSFYVFNKTNLYAGTATNPAAVLVHESSGTIGGELPAITYDNTETNLYLLQNANGSDGTLRLFSIINSSGTPVLQHTSVPCYIGKPGASWVDELPYPGDFAAQKGTNKLINTGHDARIQNVVFRNGSLWCVQTVILTNPLHSAVQWWEIEPRTCNILQFGRIVDQTGVTNYAYPSIAVNRFNHAAYVLDFAGRIA